MKKELLKLDLISEKPYLFFKKHRRYNNIFGVIATTISFLLISINGLICIINFLRRDELTIITSTENQEFNPKMNLNDKIFFYALTESSGRPIDPRLVEVIPTLWLNDNEKTSVEYLIENYCSIDKNYPQDKFKKLLNFDISNYKCLSRANGEDINLENTFEPPKNSYLNIYIARCKNRTENNNSCFSDEVIDEKIQNLNIFFNFFAETIGLDHHNNDNPLISSYVTEQIAIADDFKYVNYYQWKHIIYETDERFLFPRRVKKTDVGLDFSKKTHLIYAKTKEFFYPNTLSNFQFSINSSFADKYQRSYQKFQTVIANIGGISNLVLIIMKCITNFVNEGFIFLQLTEGIIAYGNRMMSKPQTSTNIILNLSGLSSQQKLNSISINNSLFSLNLNNQNITQQKGKRIEKKLKMSYLDSILLYRFCKASKKGKNFDLCINLVQRALNVQNIITTTINSNYIFKNISDTSCFSQNQILAPLELNSNKKGDYKKQPFKKDIIS